jgi:protein SCO1
MRVPSVGVLTLVALLLSPLSAQAARWGKEYVPNVPVVTQDGKTLNFYDDLIKDKIVVLSFIYTSCKDICPLATARLGEAQEKLGDRVGRDIFFLFDLNRTRARHAPAPTPMPFAPAPAGCS